MTTEFLGAGSVVGSADGTAVWSEAFFVDAGRAAECRELPPPAPIDVPRLRAAALEHAIDLVGPPLSPGAAASEDSKPDG